MCSRVAASSVVAGITVSLALSGPLVSFYALTVWWSVATILLASVSITCLLLTCWTDPGYLQQYDDRDPLIDVLIEEARPAMRETRSLRVSFEYDGDTYHKYLHDGSWVRVEPGIRRGHRYCGACHIWRPPHAHHCQHCQRCVQHFDHHCDVLQTCVGGMNHRWFTLFLLSAFFASMTLCGGGARTILLLGFFDVRSTPWQFWGTVILEPLYMYALIVSCVGWLHLGLMFSVVSTKDIINYGCGTCNERACQPGSGPYFRGQWARQWCSPVQPLPGCSRSQPPPSPQAEAPPVTEPLLQSAP